MLLDVVKPPAGPSWLEEFRREARARFEELPWPTRTDELWKRTDLARIDLENLGAPQGKPLPEFHATGEYAGVVASDEARSYASGECVGTIEASGIRQIGTALERSEKKFSSLNDALFGPGHAAIIRGRVDRPVNLISLFRGGAFFPRSLVVVEPESSAVVLDERLGTGEGLCVGHTEVRVQAGGKLVLIRLVNMPRANYLETIHATLGNGASLQLVTADLESKLSKITIDCDLGEPGSGFVQNGLVRARGTEHYDLAASIRHVARATASNLLVKCAVRDKARTIFSGLIKVEPGAAKTEAFQTNRNLLLSPEARADSIPRLEILADDVQCGHASATGSIDPDQLFYLQSRGLGRGEAERLIVEGFFEDVLGRVKVPPWNEWVLENLRRVTVGGAA